MIRSLLLFTLSMVIGFFVVFAARVVLVVVSEAGALRRDSLAAPAHAPDPMELEVQWGGYYAERGEEGYRVFRLLDLRPDTCHIATFDRIYARPPSWVDISFLIPERDHVVLDSLEFLAREPVFLGQRELEDDDLLAYRDYLQRRGVRGDKLYFALERLKTASREAPLPTRISAENGLLTLSPAMGQESLSR